MKTIILGLSACLSACVSAVPVARTDSSGNGGAAPAATTPSEQREAPGPRKAPPPATEVASSFTINLDSSLAPFEPDRIPRPQGFEDQLLYATEYPLVSRTLYRLRLGFFATERDAEAARAKLIEYYPQAWITRVGTADRTAARQQTPAGKVASVPVETTGDSAAHAERTPSLPATVGYAPLPTPLSLGLQAQAHPGAGSLAATPSTAPGLVPQTVAIGLRTPRQQDTDTEVSYGRDEDESVFVRSTHKGGDLFTVGTAFTQRHELTDLQARAEDDQGYWNMNISSADRSAGPAFEAEFAQSAFDPETSDGFGSSQNRMMKLATFGSWQDYQLGLAYQTVGTQFEKAGKAAERRKRNANHPKTELKQGRQGTEAWIARQFGDLGVKTLATVYQDQDEEDGAQFTTQKLGASLNYSIMSWPQVGVTVDYARGLRSGFDGATGAAASDIDVQSIASSLYYSDSTWSGTLYLEDAIGAGTGNTMDLRTYYLGGSYFPIPNFSLSPGFSYVQEQYTDLGASTDSYSASMTASYKPSSKSRFSFNGYSEYSTQENADWALDTEYYYNSLGVNWVSDKPKPLIKQWSFEVFHDQYTDNVYSDSSVGGLGFWFTLKSSPAPIRRYVDELR